MFESKEDFFLVNLKADASEIMIQEASNLPWTFLDEAHKLRSPGFVKL